MGFLTACKPPQFIVLCAHKIRNLRMKGQIPSLNSCGTARARARVQWLCYLSWDPTSFSICPGQEPFVLPLNPPKHPQRCSEINPSSSMDWIKISQLVWVNTVQSQHGPTGRRLQWGNLGPLSDSTSAEFACSLCKLMETKSIDIFPLSPPCSVFKGSLLG